MVTPVIPYGAAQSRGAEAVIRGCSFTIDIAAVKGREGCSWHIHVGVAAVFLGQGNFGAQQLLARVARASTPRAAQVCVCVIVFICVRMPVMFGVCVCVCVCVSVSV